MKKFLIALSLTLFASTAYAQEEIYYVDYMTHGEIARLANDVGGRQGDCTYYNALDLKEYNTAVMIIIPEDSHGVEFYIEYELRMICGRFSEDYYDHDGTLMYSIDYDDIEVYSD